MLVRRPLLDQSQLDAHHGGGLGLALWVGLVGVYGGYFGAGAGVMLLALLLFVTGDTMPRSNAVKNVVLGLANGVAASPSSCSDRSTGRRCSPSVQASTWAGAWGRSSSGGRPPHRCAS